MQLKNLFFIVLITSFCISCNDQPTCIPEQTDLLKITFVDLLGKAKKNTFVSITADGSNENFPIFKDTTHSVFTIPLNPIDSTIIIRFEQDTSSNYVAFSYVATPVVLHPNCALETNFDFLKMDSTDFRNALVTDPLLSLETPKNAEITH